MTQPQRRRYLLQALLQERPEYRDLAVPQDTAGQKQLLRALLNVREAAPCSPEFIRVQDEYLQAETAAKGITDVNSLCPVREGLYLWQGDITTLRCDAIVNAANSGMTGCYVPNHRCIDNCIHTFAGVELRNACDRLMRRQGRPGKSAKNPSASMQISVRCLTHWKNNPAKKAAAHTGTAAFNFYDSVLSAGPSAGVTLLLATGMNRLANLFLPRLRT